MRKKKTKYSLLLLIACFLLAFVWSGSRNVKNTSVERTLVWADEFDQGELPDPKRWSYMEGDGCPGNCGWGNNELQYYTREQAENARIENGNLIIETHRQPMGKQEYTSARIISKNKGDWRYGKMVARAKLPIGRGVWPAIWMLPTEWKYGSWPASGEIDIMEFVGYMPDSLFGTVHTQKYNHVIGTQVSKGIFSETLSTEFHEYGIEWDAHKIDFLFDGKVYLTFDNRGEGSEAWPFDQPFHFVLNIAVGGNWGGQQGVDTTIWPQRMEVDYVRVYQ